MGRRHRRHRRRKDTVERAAERRSIHMLNDWDTPLNPNDARIIETQLKNKHERRCTRSTNLTNAVVGFGKIAAGVGMGLTCLNFEKTGSLTSAVSRSVIGGISKHFH